MTYYDYLVIGASSAGCIVVNRLTEDPEATVLLLISLECLHEVCSKLF